MPTSQLLGKPKSWPKAVQHYVTGTELPPLGDLAFFGLLFPLLCCASVFFALAYLNWVEGLRRFWSMFPLTRVLCWYRFFEPQPSAGGQHYVTGVGSRHGVCIRTVASRRLGQPAALPGGAGAASGGAGGIQLQVVPCS